MSASAVARLGASAHVAPALRERERDGGPPAPAAAPGRDGATTGPRESVPLTRLPRDATGIVAGVRLAADAVAHDPAMERMALRLMEIGFVEGAQLRVVAFGQPGDDPIGVRVGGRGGSSIFALRRVEASCVWVWPDR